MIFHLVLNPDALISCRLIPECLVQISRRCEKRRDGGKKKKKKSERYRWRLSRFCHEFAASSSFGGNERRKPRGACRLCEKTILFLRAGTHVLSRSPGSRDERALRAPLKATPDSKPRPSPATLAPELPLLLPLALCPFSLGLPLALANFPLYLFLSFFPFPFVSLLSLSEFYLSALSHCLSCSIFALRPSPSTSRLTLSSCS